MLKVSLRNLLVNKLRLLLTIAAVTVGVAFVSGTFVLSDTMVQGLRRAVRRPDLGHRRRRRGRKPAFDADVTTTGGQLRPLDEAHGRRPCSEVPGVAVAEGGVTGFALILDKHGEPDPARRRAHPRHAASRRHAGSPATVTFRAGRAPPAARTRSRSTRAPPRRPATSSATRSTSCSRTAGGPSRWSASSASARPTACSARPWPGSTCPPRSRCSDKVGVVDEVDVRAERRRERRASCATAIAERAARTASRR